MIYKVHLIRSVSHEAEISVEAETEEGAKYKALEEARSICWPIFNAAEYDVLSITEQNEAKNKSLQQR